MFSPEDFLTILKFLKDNPDSDNIDLNNLVLDDTTKLITTKIKNLTISQRKNVINLFKRVIDQAAFNSADYNRFRKFLIDWYSSMSMFTELQRKSTDPYTLPPVLLDKALKSFGFDFGYGITDDSTRSLFLLSLIGLYKIKGTPQALETTLNFMGLDKVSIYEWWIKKHASKPNDLVMEGRDVINVVTDPVKKLTERITLPYSKIENETHWYYTKEQIIQLQNDVTKGKLIGLPSISPFITITANTHFSDVTKITSFLRRQLLDEYNLYISNGNNLPVSTQVNYLDIYGKYISTLELFLALSHVYNKWIDYDRYIHLRNWLLEQGHSPPTFTYPYRFEHLNTWITINTINITSYIPLYTDKSTIPSSSMNHTIYTKDFNISADGIIGGDAVSEEDLYDIVVDDHNNLINKNATYDDLVTYQSQYKNEFSKSNILDFIGDPETVETVLNAINPDLKTFMDTKCLALNHEETLQELVKELDIYVFNNLGRIPLSFTSLFFGTGISEHMLDIINFFKPKRARLIAIQLIFSISEPLFNSIRLKDSLVSKIITTPTEILSWNDYIQSLNIQLNIDEYFRAVNLVGGGYDNGGIYDSQIYADQVLIYPTLHLSSTYTSSDELNIISTLELFDYWPRGTMLNYDSGGTYDDLFWRDILQKIIIRMTFHPEYYRGSLKIGYDRGTLYDEMGYDDDWRVLTTQTATETELVTESKIETVTMDNYYLEDHLRGTYGVDNFDEENHFDLDVADEIQIAINDV